MRIRARAFNHRMNERIGIIVLALALVSGLWLAWVSWENRQESQCQSRYNQAVAEALQRHSQYAEEDRENTTRMVRAVVHARTREALREALERYVGEQERITEVRRQDPIPTLPPGKCQ